MNNGAEIGIKIVNYDELKEQVNQLVELLEKAQKLINSLQKIDVRGKYIERKE